MGSSADNVPQQQSQQLAQGPDTSLLADELQKQWDDRLNMHLGNILIRPDSHRKVWWSCDQCPEGFPHIWEASILNRTFGTLNAQRARCTAGRLAHAIGPHPESYQDALVVLGRSFVTVTL